MVNMNDDTLLNFALNQEKYVDQVLEKLVEYSSLTEKNKKLLKPVSSRPGVMYGSYKAHKASVENCLQFVGQLPVLVACHCPNLSALNTPIYKLAKFLVPILKPLLTNEFTVCFFSFY